MVKFLRFEKTCPAAFIPISVNMAGLSTMFANPCLSNSSLLHLPVKVNNTSLLHVLVSRANRNIGRARLSSLERSHPVLSNRKYNRIVLKWASSSTQAIRNVHDHFIATKTNNKVVKTYYMDSIK